VDHLAADMGVAGRGAPVDASSTMHQSPRSFQSRGMRSCRPVPVVTSNDSSILPDENVSERLRKSGTRGQAAPEDFRFLHPDHRGSVSDRSEPPRAPSHRQALRAIMAHPEMP
jgi:hypothetical protein